MEEILSKHPDVAECAVLGIEDELKGHVPMGFIVLNSGTQNSEDNIISDTIKMVREEIGAVAAFKNVKVIKRLPKTRSGKILRGTVRKIADNEPYKMPATIDDPAILDEIKKDLKDNNILKT